MNGFCELKRICTHTDKVNEKFLLRLIRWSRLGCLYVCIGGQIAETLVGSGSFVEVDQAESAGVYWWDL